MFSWIKSKFVGRSAASEEVAPEAPVPDSPQPEPILPPTPAEIRLPTPPDPEKLRERVYEIVLEQMENAVAGEKVILFPDCNLTLLIDFSDVSNASFIMNVRLKHPDFFNLFHEAIPGFAEDIEPKAQLAAKLLIHHILTVMCAALRGEGTRLSPLRIWNRTHQFSVCTSQMTLKGIDAPPHEIDIWTRMKHAILPYIGSQSVYWIRLYASRSRMEISCKASINGMVIPELTKTLTALAQSWQLTPTIHKKSAHQFIVLVQDESTRISCPFSYEDVQTVTRCAIDMFENETAFADTPAELQALNPAESLVQDVFSILPELTAYTLYPEVQVSSMITLLPPKTDPVHVYFTQIRAWQPIMAAIQIHLEMEHPRKKQLMALAKTSALLRHVNHATQKFIQPKDLLLNFSFLISDTYELW